MISFTQDRLFYIEDHENPPETKKWESKISRIRLSQSENGRNLEKEESLFNDEQNYIFFYCIKKIVPE